MPDDLIEMALGGLASAGELLTRGCVGNVMGAVTGVLALLLVGNLLDIRAIDPYWQNIITGMVVIAAVYADGLRGGERFS